MNELTQRIKEAQSEVNLLVSSRNNSSSSTHSEGSTIPRARNSNDSAVKRRSSDNKGQTSFMQYGRHSNQWLFEPLKETVTSFFGRKDSS